MPPNEVKGTNNNSPPFTHSPLKAAQSVRPASWQPAGNAAVWPKSAAGQRWSERRTSGRMDPVQEMDAELKRLREAPVETQTSAGKYQVSVDMSIFKPEDIQLLLSPGLLVLCAEREVPLDECTNVIRRFRRKLSIPEDVQTDAIATHMNGKNNIYRVRKLQNELADAQQEADKAKEEERKMRRDFENYRREMSNRMEDNSEFLEELARQTDQLRQKELDKLPKQGTLTDRIIQLEDEVERLQQENRDLQEQCADLQAQLLHSSVECGRSLLADGAQPSLAAELSGVGVDQQRMLNIIKEQDIDNQKLRNYINGILMRVVELHPEILEIKDEMNSSTHSSNSNAPPL